MFSVYATRTVRVVSLLQELRENQRTCKSLSFACPMCEHARGGLSNFACPPSQGAVPLALFFAIPTDILPGASSTQHGLEECLVEKMFWFRLKAHQSTHGRLDLSTRGCTYFRNVCVIRSRIYRAHAVIARLIHNLRGNDAAAMVALTVVNTTVQDRQLS